MTTPLRSPAVAMPQSREECAGHIAVLAGIEAEIKVVEADTETRVSEAHASAEEDLKPLREQAEALRAQIQAYCETRRDELTDGGSRKTVKFGTGEVSWKLGRAVVTYAPEAAEQIMQALREAGHDDCIRTRTDIDKTAVKRLHADDIAAIDGLTVETSPESFAVKPNPKGGAS